MSSSPHLTPGMLQFWIMALHLPYLKKSTKETDDSLLQDSIFDEFGELQHSMVQQLNIFWDSNPTEYGSIV